MERVLVTPRSLSENPPPELGLLTEAGFELVFPAPGRLPGEAELLDLVPGCVGWLAGVEPVSPRVVAAADRLRAISRNGTGVDNLPLQELERRGIRVLRAEGTNSVGVAELTIGLMLAVLRQIPATDAGIKAGQWPRLRGAEVAGRTVGLVGCGAIGRHVARVVSIMGADVIAYDPFRPPFDITGPFAWAADAGDVFACANIVTLHCPATPDGRPLVDAERLGRMRRGSVLINTARAALIDEDAVRTALDSGRLGGYATDVFDPEPPLPGGLAAHPRVVATSHIGGLTSESVAKATRIAVTNLLQALCAEPVA
ncbi:phosphoglycerate dehydrogenase [Kumtagia ephedrae]|uniref:Oxidoreductase n=1 Tax=Kumtagia ephedrae TaxID=2116701 RepID=A0A2P7SHE7_9HYPH|nr:phosphoglycerate dehydrogenase [Mesorhizobium ephedrae]PSJ61903.1 oxidoreductase [Mesorhizobium ephedrae]